MDKVWLVCCEECGLVCINTAENWATESAVSHFDDVHNGAREVKVYESQEPDGTMIWKSS